MQTLAEKHRAALVALRDAMEGDQVALDDAVYEYMFGGSTVLREDMVEAWPEVATCDVCPRPIFLMPLRDDSMLVLHDRGRVSHFRGDSRCQSDAARQKDSLMQGYKATPFHCRDCGEAICYSYLERDALIRVPDVYCLPCMRARALVAESIGDKQHIKTGDIPYQERAFSIYANVQVYLCNEE